MSGNFNLDNYNTVAERITAALAELPTGRRGPKTSMLRRALSGHHDLRACWPWPGRLANNGYGLATRPGDRTRGTSAHRVVWELLNGPVPPGLQVDHLCHDPSVCVDATRCLHRRCVNPTHLAAVTPQENTLRSNSTAANNARKTECSLGHGFTPENTYTDPRGRRSCRTCYRAHWRRYYAEGKSA